MSHADRILMGPGPGNPYPQVIKAFGRPVLGHLDPDFIALLDETNDRLREVFRTTNPLTFPVSATGSAGMEATIVNVLGPGDTVVIGVNGVFGERMCDVASRKGSGGNFERGHDKTEFGEKLSESNDENSAVYTIKLNDTAMNIIREFKF